MQTSNDDATIVRTIIQLSHSLQLKVLAEGVETRETEQLLVRLGCDEGQGYLYSKPVTAEALMDKYGRFGD
jgi:EAL domain-containing protein (putative c-di-GMP-specific phosphodiesterase class I)